MIRFVVLLVFVVWLLRFLRSKQTCPSCAKSIRPDRIQSWYTAVFPFGGEWQCPKCGHRWKAR